jgi:shikimate dehydrogenase
MLQDCIFPRSGKYYDRGRNPRQAVKERGLPTLSALQELVVNDLRVFRDRFFLDMEPLPVSDPPGAHKPLWRVSSLDRFDSWRISGIVGGRNPSRYSESPNLWNPYFRRLKVRGVFFAFDLASGQNSRCFVETWLRTSGALDLTVTDPFKQEVYWMLRSLPSAVITSDPVIRTRTVNHLIVDKEKGRILALNTDGLGMVRALGGGAALEARRILLIGAGGTAASIGAELLHCGSRLWIANRTPARARALAETLMSTGSQDHGVRADVSWSGFDKIENILSGIDVLISTVSAGCPIGPRQAALLPAHTVLAESKYGSKADLAGLASGRTYVDGRAMLYGQFVEAAEAVRSLLGTPTAVHRRAVRFLRNWQAKTRQADSSF